LFNRKKSFKLVSLTLLATLLIASAFMMAVNAQAQATVTILDSVGGTTTPAAGTTTYADGTVVQLSATPDSGSVFQNWLISAGGVNLIDSNAQTSVTVAAGTTYTIQAVFQPISVLPNVPYNPINQATDALIGVLASAGGTTNIPPGLYYLHDATNFTLQATPNSGWTFSHWVIYGPNLSHGGYPFTATPTNNPYVVNHGYGNRYDYQAVFTPTGSTEPTPSVPEFSGVAVIVAALAIVAIALGTYTYRRKK
jgi:hypothetical protein